MYCIKCFTRIPSQHCPLNPHSKPSTWTVLPLLQMKMRPRGQASSRGTVSIRLDKNPSLPASKAGMLSSPECLCAIYEAQPKMQTQGSENKTRGRALLSAGSSVTEAGPTLTAQSGRYKKQIHQELEECEGCFCLSLPWFMSVSLGKHCWFLLAICVPLLLTKISEASVKTKTNA